MGYLALTNGLVYPATDGAVAAPGTLLVGDGRVAGIHDTLADAQRAADGTAEVIDISGRTVLPGLFDCHVHLFLSGGLDAMVNRDADLAGAAERATAHLRAGVTTVRDLGGPTPQIFRLRDEIAAGERTGPRVVAAGPIVTVPDGHGWFLGEIVRDERELGQAIRRLAGLGVDCVKIAVSGGVSTPTSDLFAVQFTESRLRAGVAVAHELGLRVAAHASNPEAIRIAATAGVDSVEHAVILDDAALDALAHGTTVVVPTLTATNKPPEFLDDERIPAFIREKARITVPAHRVSIREAVAAGVPMAGGTDAGTTDVPHGQAATEAAQLVACGLSTTDAIAAVTRNSAALLGLGDRLGTLAPGMIADAVVVDGDPTTDIDRLRDVRLVLRDGAVVHRA